MGIEIHQLTIKTLAQSDKPAPPSPASPGVSSPSDSRELYATKESLKQELLCEVRRLMANFLEEQRDR